MKRLSKLDWRSLGVELFIVFVGLFAALQLDDWRQQRELRDAETRSLERLRDDLQSILDFSRDMLPFLERNHAAVKHVSDSFAAGHVIDDDVGKFETGLIYVGHLPALQIQRAAYDEMVASGMFARLRSEPLKRAIAALYSTQAVVESNFSWWRDSVEILTTELYEKVNLYSEDRMDRSSPLFLNEPVRRVEFDFDTLRANTGIRNGFYWAADTHSDWVVWTRRITEMTEAAMAVMEEELAAR
jgi:hypothetical protein